MKRGEDVTEYALYKADELLIIGTVDELAEFQKVKRETILFYATPSYRKRTSDKGLRVIRVD
ncbi:hypothetical protein ACEXFN_001043 [Listeria monocytogenes]|uniref:hypothetical protein n=1 Tax=Listeria monocytogenes TaxID=1639 RepID=UPI000737CD85|nr:hypothetical protein [Listeria monocytogenes]MCZ63537.1 hypothetical protein [Listeria monocytogenes serotype 4b]EAC4155361.1 hypothetical protein [Listeria monocytogenes]EAD1954464.1 hypothetical protein [Listeria monocytogenes]EAE0843573.1 hypothetical protein [Listeria monocytogenes]EAF8371741.1 hypothetical protein [Listeria monocytogenes]